MDGRKPKWFSTGERDLNVGTFEQIGKYFSQRLGDKDRYFAFQPKNETVSNREPYLAVLYYFNLSSKFAHDHCHESEKSYIRVV